MTSPIMNLSCVRAHGASRGGDRRPAARLLAWQWPARFSGTVPRLSMAVSRTARPGPSTMPERPARTVPGQTQGARGVLTRLPIMPAGDHLRRTGRGSAGVLRLAALGQAPIPPPWPGTGCARIRSWPHDRSRGELERPNNSEGGGSSDNLRKGFHNPSPIDTTLFRTVGM